MKRSVQFLLAMFMMVSYVEASESNHPTEIVGVEYRYNDAVTFYERGIRFHVYLNGDFDFDSRYFNRWRNRRVRVSRDFQGRVNRVGNVRIRYDFQGNVRRIGRVTMTYRRGFLRRVGNLTVQYNRWGDPRFYGNVGFDDFYNDYYYGNSFNVGFNWNVGAICVYNDPFFYGNEFRNNYRRVREDANYIYYRANDNSTVSRDRMLRRRKSSSNNNVRTAQTVRDRRRVGTQTNTNQRRAIQNESNNNRRRTQVDSNQNRRRNQVESNQNRRRTQVESNNNRKKRVVRNSSNNRKVESKRSVQKKRSIEKKKKETVRSERRRRS